MTNVADTTTTAPGHGPLTRFGTNPAVGGNNVAFGAQYSGGWGIYTVAVGRTAAKVVDSGDTLPGQGNFTLPAGTAISGDTITFGANFTGGSGIYTGTVGAAGAVKVVDTSDAAPGHGPFTGFDPGLTVSGSIFVFSAPYENFGHGVYTGAVGAAGATKVADTGDAAPGHGLFTSVGYGSLSGNTVAFVGQYSAERWACPGLPGSSRPATPRRATGRSPASPLPESAGAP